MTIDQTSFSQKALNLSYGTKPATTATTVREENKTAQLSKTSDRLTLSADALQKSTSVPPSTQQHQARVKPSPPPQPLEKPLLDEPVNKDQPSSLSGQATRPGSIINLKA